MQRGMFITLEGIDGSGKSTQARRITAEIAALGVEVISVREPGGTTLSERVRAILLDPAYKNMVAEAELLLFEASRAQLVRELVLPALARGAVVVCDRFADSTVAYQAFGRHLDQKLVERANAIGTCGVVPDRTIVIDLAPDTGLARAARGGADRMEQAGVDFQRRVREGYLALAQQEPDRIRVIDGSGTPDGVFALVKEAMADLLSKARELAHYAEDGAEVRPRA